MDILNTTIPSTYTIHKFNACNFIENILFFFFIRLHMILDVSVNLHRGHLNDMIFRAENHVPQKQIT